MKCMVGIGVDSVSAHNRLQCIDRFGIKYFLSGGIVSFGQSHDISLDPQFMWDQSISAKVSIVS